MKVCVGGTFNTIHAGHEYLLRTAFELGGEVWIGLTSDEFAAEKQHSVKPYAERESLLKEFLANNKYDAVIKKIDDVYGFAVEPDCGVIVVSEETLPNAHLINLRRSERGLSNLKIVVVPIIKNNDGEKLSSG